MDAIEALEVLESSRRSWREIRRDDAHDIVLKSGKEAVVYLFQTSFYQVLLYIIVGPKLGILEQCIIIDTRDKTADVDHLFVANMGRYGDIMTRTLLDLSDDVVIAKKSRDRSVLKGAIRTWLRREVTELQKSPELFEEEVSRRF